MLGDEFAKDGVTLALGRSAVTAPPSSPQREVRPRRMTRPYREIVGRLQRDAMDRRGHPPETAQTLDARNARDLRCSGQPAQQECGAIAPRHIAFETQHARG